MKITNKSEKFETELRNIKVGDVFYYPFSKGIYMKTETMFDKDGAAQANAVNLRLGSWCVFENTSKVIAVDCECIIRDK